MTKPAAAMAVFVVLQCLFTRSLKADDISNNIQTHLTDPTLDTLARDLGALMGAGSFHHGKSLGVPIGFDVGVHVPVIAIDSDNPILRDDGSKIQVTWGQAELGFSGRINVLGRLGKAFDADMAGAGLRLGLLNTSGPGAPSLAVSALYGEMEHAMFELETYSANLVFSMDFPVFHPYIGAGYDKSSLKPTEEAFRGTPNSISRSTEGQAGGYRVEAGINLSVLPFTYLSLGAGAANGNKMYHAGAGISF